MSDSTSDGELTPPDPRVDTGADGDGRVGHETAVVVPVKSFSLAKGRLADSLSTGERARLARSMATTVVRSAARLPVFVATDDADVVAWAHEHRCAVLPVTVTGLNAVADQAVRSLARRGFAYVVICHADLPLARDLDMVAGFPGVTIVADRRGDGTNVLTVPTSSGFRFRYGPGSARLHRQEAARRHLSVRWLRMDHLALDVDVPADLEELERLAVDQDRIGTTPGVVAGRTLPGSTASNPKPIRRDP